MTVLNILNQEGDVRRTTLGDLLPMPQGRRRALDELGPEERSWIKQVLALRQNALAAQNDDRRKYYPRGALFVATYEGTRKVFLGPDGYFGRASAGERAERVAECAARNAEGITMTVVAQDPVLVVTVDDRGWEKRPINGEALHQWSQFWPDFRILLVDPEGGLVESSLAELFPG